MDCSKAFDKLKHSKLFNVSKDKNVCPIIINMYEHCNANVKWNEAMSDIFNVSNGVKKGGILSALLFNLYLDPLLKKFEKK